MAARPHLKAVARRTPERAALADAIAEHELAARKHAEAVAALAAHTVSTEKAAEEIKAASARLDAAPRLEAARPGATAAARFALQVARDLAEGLWMAASDIKDAEAKARWAVDRTESAVIDAAGIVAMADPVVRKAKALVGALDAAMKWDPDNLMWRRPYRGRSYVPPTLTHEQEAWVAWIESLATDADAPMPA